MNDRDNPRRNHEHYSDETAHDALAAVAQDEKTPPRPPGKVRPLVYICSPYRGDTEYNTRRAQSYCRFAINKKVVPIAPHLHYTQFLDDAVNKERNIGISCGIELLRRCDQLWVFGVRITAGMKAEIDMAKKLGVPIRNFNFK